MSVRSTAFLAARTVAPLLLLMGAGACGRDPGPTAEELALEFRGIFPYPAVTGGGSEQSEQLAPLRDGYLVYIKGEDFDGAAAEFDRVAREHPELTEARFLQGVSLVLGGREAEAIEPLLEVVTRFPDYAPARWYLAQAYFSVGRDEDALSELRAIRRLGDLYAREASDVLAAHDRHS